MKHDLKFFFSLPFLLLLFFCVSCIGSEKNRSPGSPASQPTTQPQEPLSLTLTSQLHRRLGVTPLKASEEHKQASSLPLGYDLIPDPSDADDGLGDSQVIRAFNINTSCGIASGLTDILSRLKNCAQLNGSFATWDGAKNGNAGEGVWRLVYRNDSNKQIWLDTQTGLLWSDRLTNDSDWCQASGFRGAPRGPGQAVDCSKLEPSGSRCIGEVLYGLPSKLVIWRLPTRADFLQADLHGARYVLPSGSHTFWSATVSGVNRNQAWTVLQETGEWSRQTLEKKFAVRCVGLVP
jgi:hypothetical protein